MTVPPQIGARRSHLVIVVMGVTGCGKSSMGMSLAREIGASFLDADDFHPPANREKLRSGVALDDGDRRPWLLALAEKLYEEGKRQRVVLACSALKEKYRTLLQTCGHPVLFVHLKIDQQIVHDRLTIRAKEHELILKDFTGILSGQYRDLEPPKSGLSLDGTKSVEELTKQTVDSLADEEARLGMEYFSEGSPDMEVDTDRASELIDCMLEQIGDAKRVLLIPPDFTRLHSGAGELTTMLYRKLSPTSEVHVLPALGTHAPMTTEQREAMYPGIPSEAFLIHNWREGLSRLGEISSEEIQEISGGKLDYPIACEINKLLVEGGYDRIFSIGQLVPHEVIGIANHAKNIFVGTGGRDTINRSHFLGAVCGMESIMGRMSTPVREVLMRMSERFAHDLPITYLLTVRGQNDDGNLVTRGLYAGDGVGCYFRGARLSQQVNLTFVDEPIDRCVVYLEPGEFHSTWVGDKAVYRTRCALAKDADLLVIGPGVSTFGEDTKIDTLIRKYGYCGTEKTLEAVNAEGSELPENLSAAAHLIHGSSEGRFRITFAPGGLTKEEIESVGYSYMNPADALKKYPVEQLADGWNERDGERFYFVRNPGLGLWTQRDQFDSF